MIRFLLLAFFFLPAAVNAKALDAKEQKAIESLLITGRVQAACVLHAAQVLAPAIAKEFISQQLKALGDEKTNFLKAVKKADPNCFDLIK